MRVVVTGGTGFIGRALVRALSERGDDVVVLTRGAAPEAPSSLGPGVRLARWTPEQAGDWTRLLQGADAVVHLAGANVGDARWTDARMKLLYESRIPPTARLARAVAEHRPRVFVSGSAIGYYGTATGDRLLSEDAPPGDDFLATLTRDWEAAAAPARDAGVRTVFSRTGLVLGHGGGLLARLVPVFKAFAGGPIGSGAQFMAWVHITDAVRAILFAIDEATLEGPLNVTAPEPESNEAFTRALGAALHRPAPFRVPRFALELAFGRIAETLVTGPRAVPTRLIGAGFAFVFPDLESALGDLLSELAPVSER